MGPPNGLTNKVASPETVLPLNDPLSPLETPIPHDGLRQVKLLLTIEHPGVMVTVVLPVVPPHWKPTLKDVIRPLATTSEMARFCPVVPS